MQSDHTEGRIMIALDPSSPGRASLELVGHLIDRRDRQLLGLTIEDADLLAHARSRLATEIVFSGVARPLKLKRLERQLRAQSALIQRTFESEASRLGFAHAFKVLHGTVAAELQATASGAEMLIVELPSETGWSRAGWGMRIEQLGVVELPSVLYARAGQAEGTAVVAVIESPDELDATVRAAGSLARGGRLTLTALLGERLHAEQQRVLGAIQAVAGERPVRLRPLASTEIATAPLAHLTRASDARVLVAPVRLARLNPRFVRELLRLTRCSIMLVNPASPTRSEG